MNLLSDIHLNQVFATIAYSVIGTVTFMVAYAIIEKLSPFSVRKEISEDQNVALGIIIGSVILGLAIIIASAMH